MFEPASSQFLFESPEARDLFWLLNPASPSNFLLFEDADKPVKKRIGFDRFDRSDPTDYPTIVFNSLSDFAESITHEEDNWATFFPLGVNLLVINVDDDSVVTM